MAESIIKLRDVEFAYPGAEKNAVDGVSLDVYEGEFLAILGHNASGKSTMAKLMNALFTATGGRVEVAGLDASDEKNTWEIRKNCGMVFQNPDNQLVATIVEEDVAFGLENLGVPSQEILPRVHRALEAVGMGEYAGSAPHLLSGGQKQRVAIAGVLAMRPRVIVFDESTAMLDPSGRESVMEVVNRLRREIGLTVVWITHFMDEAAQADRLAIMSDGKIAVTGEPRDVFSDVEKVRSLGLDVPEMTKMAMSLKEKGLDIPGGIMTVDEMVVSLCRLKSET
ncbi:MAG: energy-coupling factor transporter ATPase [Clostridia bacterium]|nr:energy-coupling factor transporter ATPase [Clostridia bacterium]